MEEKLASLEGAESALAFASGMAAEVALLLSHGDHKVVDGSDGRDLGVRVGRRLTGFPKAGTLLGLAALLPTLETLLRMNGAALLGLTTAIKRRIKA